MTLIDPTAPRCLKHGALMQKNRYGTYACVICAAAKIISEKFKKRRKK